MRCRALALLRRLALMATLVLLTAPAWADHRGGVGPDAANPWVSALLWGALGLAVAMIVAIIVMVFTRAPKENAQGRQRRS